MSYDWTKKILAALATLMLGVGPFFLAGCDSDRDEGSSSDKPAASNTEHRQVKAAYEEKKNDDSEKRESDREFHARYDRNYDDQFECSH